MTASFSHAFCCLWARSTEPHTRRAAAFCTDYTRFISHLRIIRFVWSHDSRTQHKMREIKICARLQETLAIPRV